MAKIITIVEKTIKYIFQPRYRFLTNTIKFGLHKDMDDKAFLEKMFYCHFNYKLDLNSPKTFNEKLQWLKLYDRKPLYATMVDKCDAKMYVASKIGQQHIIKTYGVWDSFDEIDFSMLPNRFVLKCTHDSGGLVICRSKQEFNMKSARKVINKSLKRDYYSLWREWPYKDVKPRIIAEEYLEEDGGNNKSLIDYKFYCFNGEPKFLYVSKGLENHKTARISFVDLDWSKSFIERSDYLTFDELPPKPSKFNEMIEISKLLSKGIPFLRVDLYEVGGNIFFSELTFYPAGGFIPFKSKEMDEKLGKLLSLSK